MKRLASVVLAVAAIVSTSSVASWAMPSVGAAISLPDPANDPIRVYLPNVRPAPAHAASDRPVVYTNGCHVFTLPGTFAHFCIYGDKHAKRTVVLFGDSHIAQWFPAFDAAARSEHVKLLYITKTSCPAQSVSVRVWQSNIPYAACDIWRQHAIALIRKQKHVDLIVLGGYAHHQITKRHTNQPIRNATARANEWRAGTRRTVLALRDVAGEIIIMRDTPLMRVNSAPCLIAHNGDNRACQTPYARASASLLWKAEQQVAADYPHVVNADFTSAFCTPSRCRPVTSTRVLRWRDQSHMTVTFARLLAPRVRAMLHAALSGQLSERPRT